jgi:AcrR family transcriptional regulator
VAVTRRNGAQDSATRTALLDAAERLMVEEGYAAVTSRRVGARAGINAPLIYYYFDTMDDLFVELFRRRAEKALTLHAQALSSEQPLWAVWDLTHYQANPALDMEFVALGNHRKAVGAEITKYARKFRRLHHEVLSSALAGYGIDLELWPPLSIVALLDCISSFLKVERAYHFQMGHHELISVVERYIRRLEGERLPIEGVPKRRK